MLKSPGRLDGGRGPHPRAHHLQHSDAEEIANTLSERSIGGGRSGATPGQEGQGAAARKGGATSAASGASTASLFEGQRCRSPRTKPATPSSSPRPLHDYAATAKRVIEQTGRSERKPGVHRDGHHGTQRRVAASRLWLRAFTAASPICLSTDDSVSDARVQRAGNTIGGTPGPGGQSARSLTGLAVGVQRP